MSGLRRLPPPACCNYGFAAAPLQSTLQQQRVAEQTQQKHQQYAQTVHVQSLAKTSIQSGTAPSKGSMHAQRPARKRRVNSTPRARGSAMTARIYAVFTPQADATSGLFTPVDRTISLLHFGVGTSRMRR
jgi:hypothetical protein